MRFHIIRTARIGILFSAAAGLLLAACSHTHTPGGDTRDGGTMEPDTTVVAPGGTPMPQGTGGGTGGPSGSGPGSGAPGPGGM